MVQKSGKLTSWGRLVVDPHNFNDGFFDIQTVVGNGISEPSAVYGGVKYSKGFCLQSQKV